MSDVMGTLAFFLDHPILTLWIVLVAAAVTRPRRALEQAPAAIPTPGPDGEPG